MYVCASYAEEKGIGSLGTEVTGRRELSRVGTRSGAQIVSKNRHHFSPPTIYPPTIYPPSPRFLAGLCLSCPVLELKAFTTPGFP